MCTFRKKRWTAPTAGELKKKFDGAMFEENDNARIGIIFQNSRGEVVVALSKKFLNLHGWKSWRC